MLRSFAALLVLTLFGCAHVARPEPRIGDVNTKVVAFLWPSVLTVPLSPELWRASPWWREEDVTTPSRVVISTDRQACIMRDGDVSNPLPTHSFTCADRWRYPRARGR